MADKRKVYFYFRGNLKSHVHFFESWGKAARAKGLNLELITVLGIKDYRNQFTLIKEYRKKGMKAFVFPSARIFEYIFFGVRLLLGYKVIVHLKKRSANTFKELKKLSGNRLRYIIEFEGDAKSEAAYLKEYIYKPGFYDRIVENLERNHQKEFGELIASDGIMVVSEMHKQMLVNRYSDNFNLKSKLMIQPMSFSDGEMVYDASLRSKRKELGLNKKFVVCYIGNVFYSWQNISKTIELFKSIKYQKPKALLLLLIKRQDHQIAKEFINNHNLDAGDYILTNVPHDEIVAYLSCSDIAILLRHDHPMNNIVTSGKLLEYLACGLPTITTNALTISSEIEENNFGLVLHSFEDIKAIESEVNTFIDKVDQGKYDRTKISSWANASLSVENHINEYIEFITSL